jgi:HEAT repeat protein
MEAVKQDLWALVARLQNLHEIFRVQGEILCHGEEAVEPLAAFLLSPPSVLPQPRVAAAECLGTLGGEKAIDALIRVLDYHDLDALGPVQRLAEETVRNAAARQLGRFPLPHVVAALLAALRRRHLVEAGAALAQLGQVQAIPLLLECLEDDVKKEKATEALRQFGPAALPFLRDALRQPRFVDGVEPPLSQERRARAATLLGELGDRDAIPALRERLRDESLAVRIECALALATLEGVASKEEATSVLLVGLGEGDFLLQTCCEEALEAIGDTAVPVLLRAAQGLPLRLPTEGEERITLRARLTAIRLLGKRRDQHTAPALCALLQDPVAQIRGEALLALRQFPPSQVMVSVYEAAQHDPSRAVRAVARKVLQHWRQEGLAVPEPLSVWRRLLLRLWSHMRGRRDPSPLASLSFVKKKTKARELAPLAKKRVNIAGGLRERAGNKAIAVKFVKRMAQSQPRKIAYNRVFQASDSVTLLIRNSSHPI